jgi:hypothetical protein
MPAVQRISDQMERMVIAGDLASYLGVDRGVVLDSFKKAVAERKESRLEQAPPALRHDERILINALLTRPELAAEALPELRTMGIIATFPSRRILQAIFTLDAAGAALNFEAVHARLEGEDQNTLAHAALIEDTDVSEEEIAAALASMRRSEGEHRRGELKRQVKEFERAGQWDDALRLMTELQTMERESRGRA